MTHHANVVAVNGFKTGSLEGDGRTLLPGQGGRTGGQAQAERDMDRTNKKERAALFFVA